ncbi:adhesive domain-containing protein, partial [Furfurilactobacillus entadae]|uniref:adhesive domain-containing protein n=1 Tax=Furfurilactobacillus entadae TaxID=2922307 RepID=UPI0038B272D4
MSSTPTQSSTKTKSSFKKNLTRSVYLCGAALLIASAAVPSAVALAQTDATPRVERTGPGLAGISLLTNSQLVSNLANPLQQNADGNYNLDLTYTGSGVADVGLATKKIIMFALAQELRGKVTGAANIDVSAALTDIDLSKIPGVSAEIAIIEGLLGTLNVPGVDLNPLKNAIAQLTGPQPLGTYTANVAGTVTNNYISADITDGLGNYVRQTVSGLFTDVEATLAALPHGNPLFLTLIAAVNTLLNILEGAVSSTSTVLDDLLNVNLLGHTSAHLTTAVTNPNVAESHIYGALVNHAAVDINILTQNGDPVDLQFAQTAVNPLENYNVATPSLDQATAGDTAIKGNVVLEEPIPDGTTFKAIATLGDGSTAEGTVNPDGSFTINTKSLTAEEVVQVHIEAANGEYTKDGANASVTVQAENPTNPLENYNVATPTIDQGHAGDTKVTGSVNLETPIPDGTTFKAIATLGDGSTAEANVDVNGANGTFTINTNELTTDEIVSVAIQAVNGSTNKNGLPAEMTVQAGQPTNPLDDYNVASPTVNPATAGDTSVSGHVDLETPIPDGTTFSAVV